jgi:hypothetical protein
MLVKARRTARPAMVTTAAGRRRRARRSQKRAGERRPVAPHSPRANVVMRKPERVKNVETPRNPPRAAPKPWWKHMTAARAMARMPSSAGT